MSGSEEVLKVKRVLQKIYESGGHDQILNKMEILSAADGKMTAQLLVGKEHTNIYGTLHGGFIATLIDVTTSVAMSTHPKKGNGVSVDLTVSYLKPALIDDTIKIEAVTTKVGKNLGYSEAVITDKKGDIIAKGLHTKFVGNSERYKVDNLDKTN